jgi:hypothetical protein
LEAVPDDRVPFDIAQIISAAGAFCCRLFPLEIIIRRTTSLSAQKTQKRGIAESLFSLKPFRVVLYIINHISDLIITIILVEAAGIEPASESTTLKLLHV